MPSTEPENHRLVLRSLADLLAIVPYLIGFHPTDSVVVVALRGRRVAFAARADLPALPAGGSASRDLAVHLVNVLRRQDAGSVAVIGYGDADRVEPAVRAVRDALAETGLTSLDELRVSDGRYWSLRCDDPDCCPPEGVAFDAASSEVAASATYAGRVALPDRQALVRRIAPVEGAAREAMRRATRRARNRLDRLLAGTGGADLLGTRAVRTAGEEAVRDALARHRDGGALTDDEVAWLSLLLTHVPVRDHAWRRLVGADEQVIMLWTDVLRRAEPDLVPPPASLLAFAAWRAGQGALAAVALDRALAADPAYSMAVLLDQALRAGIPPSVLDDWPNARATGPSRRRPGPGARRRALRP